MGLNAEQQFQALQAADIVLGDTMGEMFSYYAIADVVLMGGTWLAYGGQNFLEPLLLGKTVFVGGSTYNFEDFAKIATDNGAIQRFNSMGQAMTSLEKTVPNLKSIEDFIRTTSHPSLQTLAVVL